MQNIEVKPVEAKRATFQCATPKLEKILQLLQLPIKIYTVYRNLLEAINENLSNQRNFSFIVQINTITNISKNKLAK